MGRPPIGKRAMTDVERMRRYRERLRDKKGTQKQASAAAPEPAAPEFRNIPETVYWRVELKEGREWAKPLRNGSGLVK